jgi:hypothetical protein
MVRCGVHRDVHGRENYVLFGFTLICFVEVSFSILIFVFNFACLCPRRFPYQIMFASSSRNTTGFLDDSSSRRLLVGFKKEQCAMTYKVLHRTLWTGVNSDAKEGSTVPASLVNPVVFLQEDANMIWYGNRLGHKHAKLNTNIKIENETSTKQMREFTVFCVVLCRSLHIVLFWTQLKAAVNSSHPEGQEVLAPPMALVLYLKSIDNLHTLQQYM